MTAPPGGAPLQVAPEGLGPEGVLGEGAAPRVVGGAGGTSNQLPHCDSRAPSLLIEEVGAPSSQSSGQAVLAPSKGDGDHVFRVGGMFWLEYANKNMPKTHRQCFVGKVTAVEGGRVKWAWMDETGSASRWISVAKAEGVRQVTQEELKIMCSDFGHALEDVLCAMEEASEVGDGEAAELSSNVPASRHLSFAGFGNAFTMARWRNLEKWLRRDFKVEQLLDRLHRVFTHTGEVATQASSGAGADDFGVGGHGS